MALTLSAKRPVAITPASGFVGATIALPGEHIV